MEHGKYVLDVAAIAAAFSSFLGYVSPFAAVLSAIWLSMQIVINWRKFMSALRALRK